MSALTTIATILDEAGWRHAPLDGRPGLALAYRSPLGTWTLAVTERPEVSQILAYSVLAKPVPEPRRFEVMAFLTRANFDLPIGNFELDLDRGELRFKSSVDLEGGELTEAMARQLVHTNLRTMERYYLGLMEVMAGLSDPAEAVEACEDVDGREKG